jgi:hypothetical protein
MVSPFASDLSATSAAVHRFFPVRPLLTRPTYTLSFLASLTTKSSCVCFPASFPIAAQAVPLLA